MRKIAVTDCCGALVSVTWKVRRDPGTASDGVPLITPVAVFSDSPPGSLPAIRLHV
jgi:hypothetical protein